LSLLNPNMRTSALTFGALAALLGTPLRAAAETPRERDGKTIDKEGASTDTLTPLRPQSPEEPLPAYQLYLEVDAPLLAIAVVFGIGRSIRGGLAPAFCAPAPDSPTAESTHCDPSGLNWLDRQVAGRYQPGWRAWSDIGLYGIEALAAGGILAHGGLKRGLNDLVVVAEATLLASAASGASTAITGRPRPYMYGTEAPLAVRQSGDGGLSYFSGHTSTAFGAVTATFVTFRRLYPDSRWPWVIYGAGVAAASFVGATRILAGSHFPTDVAAGAAVGAAVGLLVPALHAAPRRIGAAPMAVVDGGGVALYGPLP
jgi:membrane-associated phospholipid phosphatase